MLANFYDAIILEGKNWFRLAILEICKLPSRHKENLPNIFIAKFSVSMVPSKMQTSRNLKILLTILQKV